MITHYDLHLSRTIGSTGKQVYEFYCIIILGLGTEAKGVLILG